MDETPERADEQPIQPEPNKTDDRQKHGTRWLDTYTRGWEKRRGKSGSDRVPPGAPPWLLLPSLAAGTTSTAAGPHHWSESAAGNCHASESARATDRAVEDKRRRRRQRTGRQVGVGNRGGGQRRRRRRPDGDGNGKERSEAEAESCPGRASNARDRDARACDQQSGVAAAEWVKEAAAGRGRGE